MLQINQIHLGDCLELMKDIDSNSIDMILTDLPYGVTANKWDSVIPLGSLWAEYNRIIKHDGAIALTAKQPFTSILIVSNLDMFKYSMVWRKNLKTGNLNARKRPMGSYEDIAIFYKSPPAYHPQRIPRTFQQPSGNKFNSKTTNYGKQREEYVDRQSDWLMPDDVIDYEDAYSLDAIEMNGEMLYVKCLHNSSNKQHPTQKPSELMELLIRMYTNEHDTVLDSCAGSGTTAIAALNTNRNYICIELDPNYHKIATERVQKWYSNRFESVKQSILAKRHQNDSNNP